MSGNGPNCVEVAAWQQTTGSDATGGRCMEVVHGTSSIEVQPDRLFLVRDSKDPDGPVLSFAPAEWDAFLSTIKSGGLDALA
ncbi:DUF397 domain-containing protein [Streptosporangium sandarakinum]|uniref:DUF397 domain-containing protein n=1 Tax=Streptosporangium TaxID=2000 RepID=UPI0035EAEBB2